MTDVNRELVERVQLGFDVEDFLRSRIGRYLEERGRAQVEEGLNKLAEHSPVDADGIRAIQAEIAVARQWRQWLEEAIADGELAQQEAVDLDGQS